MKNINDVIEETYNRLHVENPVITKKEVEEIILFMFEHFKSEMNTNKHTGIKIVHVGDFILSHALIENHINRINNLFKYLNYTGPKYENVLAKFNTLLPIFNKIIDYRKTILENRKIYLKNKYGNP